MTQLLDIKPIDLQTILETLKPYQRDTISSLISTYGEEQAAEKWLAASGPASLEKFGAFRPSKNPLWLKVLSEFKMLVCGHEKYQEVRDRINKLVEPHIQKITTTITAAIAIQIGTASEILFPAVSILFYLATGVGISIWCET